MVERYIGIDIGAETLKLAELTRTGESLRWSGRALLAHHKEPLARLRDFLSAHGWEGLSGAAVSGRFSRQVNLRRIPVKTAQAAALRYLAGDRPATLVSIGSHGFSVLEVRGRGPEVWRENSRCSQGTGSFLHQLVERFGLSIEEAAAMVESVAEAAPLSGRCPVILKTDMTHLANRGECRASILAGLYDAVCENVQVLLKPGVSPERVVLIGGVTRAARVHRHFDLYCRRNGLALQETRDDDALYFEALGSALIAAARPQAPPALEEILSPTPPASLEEIPPLSASLDRVTTMSAPPLRVPDEPGPVLLGLDIGSTGSKAVALDTRSGQPVWESYTETGGDPVGASQRLVRSFSEGPASRAGLAGFGVTGSGREIVGSLLTTCYGPGRVFVLNEIAAHAGGALHHDPLVDTIFEIGGQDAKYIRLEGGRVVDAAMNEACSAGTGSFIAEQGNRFAGIPDVAHLGEEAIRAEGGVSLGQHCSVFMAEIIDEAVAAGVDRRSIIAGIYDSVIANYLNRVKGDRSVGEVVFCQGMPFAAPALAAAVARRTGSRVVVPPGPGTVGALGISLLARRDLALERLEALDPRRYLATRLERKETFLCKSTEGCGGSGNRCRIDRIRTSVEGRRQQFTWGGACSLHDRGMRGRKLPDRSPDPFREREELAARITREFTRHRGLPRIALTDEFVLKPVFPFFVAYLHGLGLDPVVHTGADQATLKRGIERAGVPFCAPMQQYHGLVTEMAEEAPEFLFLPMVRNLPRFGDEHSVSCPLAQGSSDVLRLDLGNTGFTRLVSPVIDFGPGNLASKAFRESCRVLAGEVGCAEDWKEAFERAVAVQAGFEKRCLELGREALAFCREHKVEPVVVLGRPYTIYNRVLNSNVPALLREQGAVPIPVDCYPLEEKTPVFQDVYWGHGQRNLRAAHQVRRTPGLWSLFCSNYSCGPDSFNIHFCSYLMEGKPFAVIETDGHSGDAGTRTRIEAFLYCVREEEALIGEARGPAPALHPLQDSGTDFEALLDGKERVLFPHMSDGAEVLVATYRGLGMEVETLPPPGAEELRIGRRYTSGKECLPLCLTLGGFLRRIQDDPDRSRRFCLLMPTNNGPCRFGVYNLFQKIVVEKLGLADRVRVWSPTDGSGYFGDACPGIAGLAYPGGIARDVIEQARCYARPVEKRPGAADEIYQRRKGEILEVLEREAGTHINNSRTILEAMSGRFYGFAQILRDALVEFSDVMEARDLPTVALVGEVYVRLEPFANDHVIRKLEERGIRVRIAHATEWLEYISHLNLRRGTRSGLGAHVAHRIQLHTYDRLHDIATQVLGWPRRMDVLDAERAGAPYVRPELHGEAVLTLGGPIHEWREEEIDGAVVVGPLECMPTKIAESQFFHAAEREGLRHLTLAFNGDPLDPDALDAFVYDVKENHRRRRKAGASRVGRETGLLRRMAAGARICLCSALPFLPGGTDLT